MRGKVNCTLLSLIHFRITPAYAGKRLHFLSQVLGVEDHPRLCGEKLSFPLPIVRVMGSPPPMRGKESQSKLLPLLMRDHPRLCGEKTKKIPKQRYFFHQPASFSFSLQYT